MAPRSFKKLTIAVSGTFPGYKQADLKAMVEGNGATFTSSVTAECTHLITTQKEVDKNGTKYQNACGLKKCEIVTLDWLLESNKAKKPVAEKSYHFGTAKAATQTNDTQAKATDTKKSNGRKRAAKEAVDTDDEDDTSNKKAKAKAEDAQRVTGKAVKIPVDDCFYIKEPQFKDPAVYIDKSGLIWDATLNQTVSSDNANKFYRIQLLQNKNGSNHQVWTRWGRVGENGQSALLGDGTLDHAKAEFQKKFKAKSGLTWQNRLKTPLNGKYTFIERNYEESDDEDDAGDTKVVKQEKPYPESTLSTAVQNLVSFIFNQEYFLSTMANMSYDAKKLPLGKLSKRTLQAGFEALKELAELAADPSLANTKYGTQFRSAMEQLSNRYFTTIPHVFGRNRPPVLDNESYIKKEVELLETLTDMEVANSILKDSAKVEDMNPIDRQYAGLGMEEMTQLDHKSDEFIGLEKYLKDSRGETHHMNYKVVDIFRIERKGEHDRYNDSPYADMENGDRRLLWHGSRSTNFGGILSQGLRIAPPEAPVSGYMFGKGVYFADVSSKSANYCCSYNSGGKGILLLCDVQVGAPLYELFDSDYHAGENAKKEGKIATLGKGRTKPGSWKDASCIHPSLEGVQMPDNGSSGTDNDAWLNYNEYIVYDVAQIRQRYLFFVNMR